MSRNCLGKHFSRQKVFARARKQFSKSIQSAEMRRLVAK
jgi:hypothetical protein